MAVREQPGVADAVEPVREHAEARCTVRTVIGRAGSGPGTSQGRERVRRQWVRRIASSCGESMT